MPNALSTLALWPYPFWIAHRGAGRRAPENTLAAFRAGWQLGFRMFECDVKLSSDGVPFLLHDDTLDRTTSGRGDAALPWHALASLDAGAWHGPAHLGEPVATLEAVAGFAIGHGCAVNLEIKPVSSISGDDARTGAGVAREAARLWANQPLPPLLSSFSVAALAAAGQAAPGLPRALLIDRFRPAWEEDAKRLASVAVVAHFELLDAALIARQHAQGRRVLAYTVDDPAVVAALKIAGIDGLITDAVEPWDPPKTT